MICGGYFIYIVCAIGAEDFRIEFLNKYSAMYNDIKVNNLNNKSIAEFQTQPFAFMLTAMYLSILRFRNSGHW